MICSHIRIYVCITLRTIKDQTSIKITQMDLYANPTITKTQENHYTHQIEDLKCFTRSASSPKNRQQFSIHKPKIAINKHIRNYKKCAHLKTLGRAGGEGPALVMSVLLWAVYPLYNRECMPPLPLIPKPLNYLQHLHFCKLQTRVSHHLCKLPISHTQLCCT